MRSELIDDGVIARIERDRAKRIGSRAVELRHDVRILRIGPVALGKIVVLGVPQKKGAVEIIRGKRNVQRAGAGRGEDVDILQGVHPMATGCAGQRPGLRPWPQLQRRARRRRPGIESVLQRVIAAPLIGDHQHGIRSGRQLLAQDRPVQASTLQILRHQPSAGIENRHQHAPVAGGQ